MEKEEKVLLKKIGTNLRKLRLEIGMDRESLSKMIKVNKTTISNWENGIRLPKLKYWMSLLIALKCNSLDDLFKPVIENFKNDELDNLVFEIKDIFRNKEAKEELYIYLDIIKKRYKMYERRAQREGGRGA